MGRTSLLIGLVSLAVAAGLSDLVGRWLSGTRIGPLLREGLLIGGWVAMRRPLEIFLYDWWPDPGGRAFVQATHCDAGQDSVSGSGGDLVGS